MATKLLRLHTSIAEIPVIKNCSISILLRYPEIVWEYFDGPMTIIGSINIAECRPEIKRKIE